MQREEGYDRGWAITALGLIGDRRATSVLLRELYSDDTEVNDAAAEALGLLNDPDSFEPLMQAMTNGPVHARSSAAYVLGELGDPRAIDALRSGLRDATGYVSICAARALAKIGGHATIDALIDALEHGVPKTKESAAKGLEILKAQKAVDALVIALRDEHPDVRKAAASALAEIGDLTGNAALLAALERRDVAAVLGGYDYFIRQGIPGSEPLLIEALNCAGPWGTGWMAQCFISSGNEALAEAGRQYFRENSISNVKSNREIPIWASARGPA